MHSPWYRRLMDRIRTTGWWPVHYRTDTASWWCWRGGYYRFREDDNGRPSDG